MASFWVGMLQISMYLPNVHDLDTCYDSVYTLSTTWSEISRIGSKYMHQVFPISIHDSCRVQGARHVGEDLAQEKISPNWNLLRTHLFVTGPEFFSAAELEDCLFINRSHRPGVDT